MGIGQVSHCQAQPVGLNKGHRMTSSGRAHLCRWSRWRIVPSLNGFKSFCHHERRHCHALRPHFTIVRIFSTEIALPPVPGGCRSPSNTIWHWIAQGQPPCIAKRHLDPVQLFKHSSRVWQTYKTDGHSPVAVVSLNLGCCVEKHPIFSVKSCWIFQSWLEGVDRASLCDFLWQVFPILQHSVTEIFT